MSRDHRRSSPQSSHRRQDSRDRSRSSRDRRDRSMSHSRSEDSDEVREVDPMEGMDEEAKMMALMGFKGFETTHGKKIQSDQGAVSVNKQRTYRQYMNRRRGFNRNLSPTR
ncbi:U4/U6.U5 small nuclear ribonucleoprotein 27 kDa protein-like protein [Fimicolochytrium jonesii]|uniref:U4/U6.U5 small nuclear ribonucleoprotein 27 kDa protein-like protein n=1 Tax=Fimicolochytrium jonesii TaxID=1396493 RepID=UPI0022FEDAD5|nr:U4/U6.U5 small nuclear ribonucleoprotein 27 kDa protein-like protein [Fimicolochytrium jonesii]KAI8819399.1 U4/U6.U5 small nuclear ribonucleoprotein 27 kDa protein-like protein [Fimicolochytrium jonesii]